MSDNRRGGYCAKCIYYAKSVGSCDYILIAGHPRPCPGGDGCTARVLPGRRKSMKAKWDTMQGYMMHLDGKSDKEIADHFGVAVSSVAHCRKRNWEKLSPPQLRPVQS